VVCFNFNCFFVFVLSLKCNKRERQVEKMQMPFTSFEM